MSQIGMLIVTILQWMGFIVLIAIILLIALTIVVIIGSPSVTEEEIYSTLSYPNWKTGMQIKEELRELKGIKTRRYFFDIPPPYIHLSKLVDDGFAESREKEISKETWLARGELPQLEFRRTGKKREKKQPHLDAVLEPSKP